MNPYRVLGLDGDASEADVKRAYARLLKQHRPDTDPEGFQRLHEAYTHCLARARYRAEHGAEDDEDEIVVAGEAFANQAPQIGTDGEVVVELSSLERESTAQLQEEEEREDEAREATFNVDAFIDELTKNAHQRSPAELTRWLHGHDGLYSLQLKQFLTGSVANAFAQLPELPQDENVGVVMTFFGLDGVGRQHPWVAHSLQVLWSRLEDRRAFERLQRHYTSPVTSALDRIAFRELISPRHWLRFLAILLWPTFPSRTRTILIALEHQAPSEARARVVPEAARFWRSAADRERLNWRRWLVALLRLPWIVPVIGYISAVSQSPITAKRLGIPAATVFGGWVVLAIGFIGWRRLLRFNQERLHWDIPLAAACSLLAVALVAGYLGAHWVVGGLCGLTLMFWSQPRSRGVGYLAMFTAFWGGALVLSLWILILPIGTSNWRWILAAVYGVASIIAHDALYARAHRNTLEWGRGQLGWLAGLLTAHFVLTLAVLLLAAQSECGLTRDANQVVRQCGSSTTSARGPALAACSNSTGSMSFIGQRSRSPDSRITAPCKDM